MWLSCCGRPLLFMSLSLADLLWTEKNFGFDAGFWVQCRGFVSPQCDGHLTCWGRSSGSTLSLIIHHHWVGPLEVRFFAFCLVLFLPLLLNVRSKDLGFTHAIMLISTCALNILLFPFCCVGFHLFSSSYLCKTMTLEKQHTLMMQASAKLQQASIFCCLKTLLMARMCKLSAQGCKSVSPRWGHVCVLHAHFAAQLCCWGGFISSASLQDLLVSHSAPQRAVFSFLLLLRVSAAPLMFDQPKKQPRGLFIPHVFRAKGRSSTVTDIRAELVRFDFFQPGCRLKRVCPLCSRQLRG